MESINMEKHQGGNKTEFPTTEPLGTVIEQEGECDTKDSQGQRKHGAG